MITFKAIVIPGGRRRDGTHPVKIRVTFRGVSRRLPTTLACLDSDLTRAGKIKSADILERSAELIARMRASCADLSPFTLEAWDVDRVVEHIRARLSTEDFSLDFFAFAEEVIGGKLPHTKAYYRTALNAFAAYLGRDAIDVNQITRKMLRDFTESVGEVKAARHLAKLSYIYRCAREQYNDEDAGAIRIPRQPFAGCPKIRPMGKGQKALPPEVIQRLIDYSPASVPEAVAVASFIFSFCTMGANMADLYDAPAQKGQIWPYLRHKTRNRRTDRAEVKVRLEPETDPFLAILGKGRKGDGAKWLLPELRRWQSADVATHNVNKWLRRWAEREGVPPFTFYAARHSWATYARREGVEKATIDEALGHVGDFKVTDVYAERNWELAWAANRRVLELFRWPDAAGQESDKK